MSANAPQNLDDKIDELTKMVSDLHTALVGRKDLGTPGLISRMEKVESRVESHDRKLLVWTSCGALLVALFQIALRWWK